MLNLKQTLHKVYTQSFKNISQAKQDLEQHLVALRNSQFLENLGTLLSNLILLAIIILFLVVACILNLLYLIVQMLTMLIEPSKNIAKKILMYLSISCRWAVEVKNTILQSTMWQNFAWRKVGDSHQDFTYPSSEMPGVLDDGTASRYTNEHLEDVMKKDIDHSDLEKRIREAGY